MFGSEILEVAIGIIFVFMLVAIICSAIREGVEAWLKTRAAFLEHGIRELLDDPQNRDNPQSKDKPQPGGIAAALYDHPLISSLYSGKYTPGGKDRPKLFANGKKLPSYIPAKNFAVALMDIAVRGPITDSTSSHPNAPVITPEAIRANILNINNPKVQRVLLTAVDSARGNLDLVQEHIQAWYDSGMDRVSGWYKRSTQWILFWIGLFVAVAMNINTIAIGDFLYRNDAAREALVKQAETASADTEFLSRHYAEVKNELLSTGLPIGWDAGWEAVIHGSNADKLEWWRDVFSTIFGWLLTALAATLGAPFWFDLLNKVMVIRSTVKPHEKSPEEASEDRQTRNSQTAGTTQTLSSSSASTQGQPTTLSVQRVLDASDTEIIR